MSLLLVFALLAEPAYAQRGGGRSYTSGGTNSGRSYTSGSRTPPAAPRPTPRPTPPKPPAVKPRPAPPRPTPPVKPPSGKTYASGGGSGGKFSSGSWNIGLTNATKKSESRDAYAKTKPAAAPAPAYKTPKGEQKPLKADAPAVSTVRKTVTHERYVTYDNRASVFYGPHYSQPHVYNDWFSPFLMGYLFSDAVKPYDRAMWVHCHRNEIDDTRYKDLIAKDRQLEVRLKELEQNKIARDQGYALPSMQDNPDLQYSQEFVNAAYNPESVPSEPADWSGVVAFFLWVAGVAVVAGLGYLLFVKEYDYVG